MWDNIKMLPLHLSHWNSKSWGMVTEVVWSKLLWLQTQVVEPPWTLWWSWPGVWTCRGPGSHLSPCRPHSPGPISITTNVFVTSSPGFSPVTCSLVHWLVLTHTCLQNWYESRLCVKLFLISLNFHEMHFNSALRKYLIWFLFDFKT